MKLKIKVRKITPDVKLPEVISKGDWVDLYTNETVFFKAPQANVMKRKTNTRNVNASVTYIHLGIAMQLPEGFEAIVAPRSSTPEKFGVMCANSIGIIDNTYCGDNDEWKFPAIPIRETTVKKDMRICQFRIQLSQKANIWQKLRWLLSDGIEFEVVENLNNVDREGIGSTGVWKEDLTQSAASC